MEIGQCTFGELSFSKLFTQYVTDFSVLTEYYSTNPFDNQAVAKRANSMSKPVHAAGYVEALKEYHAFLGIQSEQSENLSKLAKSDAIAIVTGQQLGVYGGPIFTIYKTLTAIKEARKLEKELSRPVVPVFWLADEDHDFREIARFNIPGSEQLSYASLKIDESGQPVSEVEVAEYARFRTEAKELLFDTDFSPNMWELLDNCYSDGTLHSQAFAKLISSLFSKHGVVVAGSNFKSVKALLTNDFIYSIDQREGLHQALKIKSDAIAGDFHQQVVLGTTNLFYLDADKGRIKLGFENGTWNINGVGSYSSDELKELVHAYPERFSPNVFLRPIIQDKLLPTLGYVAGPGELAYYGQMLSYYEAFDMVMPVIYPRISASLVERGTERALDKLPLEFSDFSKRIEDLESEYIAGGESADLDGLFARWKNQAREVGGEPIERIKEIDPTLKGTSEKVIAQFETELDKLKGKVFRSVKQQEQTQLNRIRKVKAQLFPGNGLQERSVSFPYFMNKYGNEIWDQLLVQIEEQDLDSSLHHIFYL